MLSINISELVLTAISFFLLFFLLKRFLYDPLLRFMDERNARIEEGLDAEKQALAAVQANEMLLEAKRKEMELVTEARKTLYVWLKKRLIVKVEGAETEMFEKNF